MELLNEAYARYVVHHEVTEEKLVHLDSGVRKLGFRSGGRRIVTALAAAGAMALTAGYVLDGIMSAVLFFAGCMSLFWAALGLFSVFNAARNARKAIHIQYEKRKNEGNHAWEYRFFDDCYEVIGRFEKSRVQYRHIGRLIEISGMLALVEKGNLVRYFMKSDVTGGSGDELAAFLEQKSGLKLQYVRVRGR